MVPGKKNVVAVSDILIRAMFWFLFVWLELSEPFIRDIQPEELYLYKYPNRTSIVPNYYLWVLCLVLPICFVTVKYFKTKDRSDFINCLMCITLALGMNGFLTSLIKVCVGRPRPDFYYRCFPEEDGEDFNNCQGDRRSIMDGRKSFPSGHSSFSFASMTLITLYLLDRWHVAGYTALSSVNQTWKLCVLMFPTVLATLIAISRTCDYHHHYQDVIAGGLIGFTIAYICYRHHFYDSSTSSTYIPLDATNTVVD